MNVIVNAHQKDKFGPGQVIIGITSDSEKSDEHVFDFVFRLFKRNGEYFAKTEKQRILPITIDPEARRFPDEFQWNYDNLLKFYNKKYLEKKTIYSNIEIKSEAKTEEIKSKVQDKPQEIKQSQNENKTVKEEKKQEAIPVNNTQQPIDITFVKSLLKENNIKASSFKVFLRDVCMWTHIQKLSDLNKQELETIVNRWDSIKTKYAEFDNSPSDDDDNDSQQLETQKEKTLPPVKQITDINYRETSLKNIKDGETIRNDQILMLKELLESKNLTVERLFSQFNMKDWSEMTSDGAANIIKYFDMFASSL